ncbi:MAG: DMT family transporter [Parahaliea sp.]
MKDDRKSLLYGLAAIFIWSTCATAFKLALARLDVFQLVAVAATCSALVLWLVVAWQGRVRLARDYLCSTPGYFALMGLINPLLYYLVLLRAYDLLSAQQAQTINYTWAITLALLAVPLLGQRLGWRDSLAALLGYSGVVVIATQGRLLDMQLTSAEGVALALASTLVWALYWILNTRNPRDPVVSLCLNFTLAAPLAWLLCALFSSPVVGDWRGLLAAAYVGLFEMGLTFALWSTALRLASGVSRVGNLIFLSPLFSLVFISSILGEAIHPATLLGLALILPGVLLQQTGRSAAPAPA